VFALLIVIEEKQLKEGDLGILVGCLVLCYRELSDIFTKIKIRLFTFSSIKYMLETF